MVKGMGFWIKIKIFIFEFFFTSFRRGEVIVFFFKGWGWERFCWDLNMVESCFKFTRGDVFFIGMIC